MVFSSLNAGMQTSFIVLPVASLLKEIDVFLVP